MARGSSHVRDYPPSAGGEQHRTVGEVRDHVGAFDGLELEGDDGAVGLDGAEGEAVGEAAALAGGGAGLGADAVSRLELGRLIARRDGLEPDVLRGTSRASLPGPVDVRLDSSRAARLLTTRLRGAREFLAP